MVMGIAGSVDDIRGLVAFTWPAIRISRGYGWNRALCWLWVMFDSLQKATRHKGKGLVRLFHTATRLKILFWRGNRVRMVREATRDVSCGYEARIVPNVC